MTTVNEWISTDARRRAPEFDFGTQWTREHDPHTDWAVTYNTGTGELYARTRNGDDVELLGQFADPQDVADALPDWGRRSTQAGSLDWARRQALAVVQNVADVDAHVRDPIYGIVINTDGSTIALREPQTISAVAGRLGSDLDVATVNTGDRTDRVIMWVDDLGQDKHLPVNAVATRLYGTGWPILGNAVIVTDDNQPLPATVTRDLLPDIDHRPDVAALDWDDHHRDRDNCEIYDFADDDISQMPELTAGDLEYEAELDEHFVADQLGFDDSQFDIDLGGGADIDL